MMTICTGDGTRLRVPFPLPDEEEDPGGPVSACHGAALAPDRRTEHERALRELHDASRRLIRAETREEVCEVAVDAAWRILGLPLNGLWLYDAERDLLEPAAWTDQGAAQFGEPPAFPVDASLVGRAFREGTHRVYDDVTAEAEPYDPDTRVRSELVLPLSEYGVTLDANEAAPPLRLPRGPVQSITSFETYDEDGEPEEPPPDDGKVKTLEELMEEAEIE